MAQHRVDRIAQGDGPGDVPRDVEVGARTRLGTAERHRDLRGERGEQPGAAVCASARAETRT